MPEPWTLSHIAAMNLMIATASNDELFFKWLTIALALYVIYALFRGRIFKPDHFYSRGDNIFADRKKDPADFWIMWGLYLAAVILFAAKCIFRFWMN